jgi:hypothetical protein
MIWIGWDAVIEGTLAHRIDTIERGYEYLLAYAAQGRQDDAGTDLRPTLTRMHEALSGLASLGRDAFGDLGAPADAAEFLDAVHRDIRSARGAIGLVMSRSAMSSLLVDNLNASVHVRALLTDLFLIEQAQKSAPRAQ